MHTKINSKQKFLRYTTYIMYVHVPFYMKFVNLKYEIKKIIKLSCLKFSSIWYFCSYTGPVLCVKETLSSVLQKLQSLQLYSIIVGQGFNAWRLKQDTREKNSTCDYSYYYWYVRSMDNFWFL